MNKLKYLFILCLFQCIGSLLSVNVFAHSLWINASDYAPGLHPGYGGRTNVYFGWGHGYPVDDFLNREDLKDFRLIRPDGQKIDLEPNPGGFLATMVSFESPGSYIVSASKNPGFYTMHMDKGTMRHTLGPKTGLKGVILSLYYEQYAKSLINVGEKEDSSFSRPIGHKLEVIPLENPSGLRGFNNGFLPVKVLFNGRPAKFCKVYATYAGFSTGDDFAYATSTNSEGVAGIRITHWGPWLVKADMRMPAPEDMKDKCNELHYTATLTFEIP